MKRCVITGMGVISPIGNTLCAFEDALQNGRCGIAPITRFDTTGFKATLAAEVKDFDPSQYGFDKVAARRTDLYTQYAMAAAAQAVEQSGIVGAVAPENFGVYVGSGIGGMRTFEQECEKLMKDGPRKVSALFIQAMIGNIASGSIAIKYNAQGPCLPVVTACATSTNAIGEAYRAITHGYAEAIVAGGTEATITPLAVAGFTNCMALTLSEDPFAASLPFDKRRAGFVMGEGAGIVVLEEYGHALKRGAPILAEICGYGNTCDAHHVTAPDPSAACSARAISLAAKEAGLSPDDTVYINAHGTGTPLNDSTETLAIKKALGKETAYRCLVSSTKSMTGHMLGAAGAVEAIACVLALSSGIVPPTIGYREKDEACDLDYVPNQARLANPTIALSCSFGFGGHNACLALRRPSAEVNG